MPPPSGPVGIAVNPASGKDIRRLVARASVFDNQEKKAIVRRLITGAIAAGVREFRYVADSHGIASRAFEEAGSDVAAEPVAQSMSGNAEDTTRGAEALKRAGCTAVVTLGGDGTNRAFVRGWRDAPMIAISTGTNNVFPSLIEATVAGACAGLVANGQTTVDDVSLQAKLIHVEIEDEPDDLALIDAVTTDERFVGARALLDCEQWRRALVARAEPAAVGISAVAGMLRPVPGDADEALCIEFGGGGRTLNAPIAPGLYKPVNVATHRVVGFGENVELAGPGVLALDGERERRLKPGQRAILSVHRDGPWVIDVRAALELASLRRLFDVHRME
ncbi:MAG: NAD(+)/NADH kinase [Gammaproteobacteria bacterium]|jgi:predicted polyphosphate/ATP-dependent NAD kinase